MKLHSPGVERGLRRAVRRVIRASPALRREARRNQQAVRHNVDPYVVRVIGIAIMISLLAGAGFGGGVRMLDAQLALVSVWLTAAALGFPHTILERIFGSPDHYPLAHLPIGEEDLFRWQWLKALRWCKWAFVESLFFFGIIGLSQAPSHWLWITVPGTALLQAAMLLALGHLLLAHAPVRFCKAASVGVYLLLFGGLIASAKFDAPPLDWLIAKAGVVSLALPAGWIGQIYSHSLVPDGWANVLLLFPLCALLWLGLAAWRQLKSHFVAAPPMEFDFPTTISGTTEETVAQEMAAVTGEKPPVRPGPTAIEDDIRARLFLESTGPAKERWLDRCLDRLANERQQFLLRHLSGGEELTSSTLWFARWHLLLGLLMIFTSLWWRELPVLFYAMLGIFFWPVAQGTGAGAERAFDRVWSGGMTLPYHGLLPVGYFEVGGLVLKGALLRWLVAAVPAALLLLGAGWLFTRLASSAEWPRLLKALMVGNKMLALLFALTPGLVALRFLNVLSAGLHTWWLAWVMLVGGTAFMTLATIGLAVALFLATSALHVTACLGALAVLSLGFFFLCGWAYNGNRTDLIHPPPHEGAGL